MATSQRHRMTRQQNRSQRQTRQQQTDPIGPEPEVPAHEIQRAMANPHQARPEAILQLQRTVGNRAVQRLIQRQVPDSATPDSQPQEAGHVTQQLTVAISPLVQRQLWIQRENEEEPEQDEEEEDEEEFDEIEGVEEPSETAVVTTGAERGRFKETATEKSQETPGKKSEKKTKVIKGSGAALKKIREADSDTIRQAVVMMAQAGWFGEHTRKTETDTGSTEIGLSGQAAASAKAGASKKVTTDAAGLVQAVQLLAASNLIVGAGGELQVKKTRKLGKHVEAEATLKLKAFAGAAASAGAKLDLDVLNKQLTIQGGASGMAGAHATGEITGKISMGDAELQANAEGEAFAGAMGEVRGKLSIGLEGFAVAGKVEAFAGASAGAKAGGQLSYKGTPLAEVSGKVEVMTGVGAKIGGKFEFKDGKLTIGGELALSLGIGGGIGLEVTVDFKAIANAIQDLIVRAIVGKKKKREPLPPEFGAITFDNEGSNQEAYGKTMELLDFVKGALVDVGLESYAKKKSKTGKHYIKRDMVQAYLNSFKQKYGEHLTVRENRAMVAKLLSINIKNIANEQAQMFTGNSAIEINDQFMITRFYVEDKRR